MAVDRTDELENCGRKATSPPLVLKRAGSREKAAMEVARIRATLIHLGHSTSETGKLCNTE
jgi:hypothetical protein